MSRIFRKLKSLFVLTAGGCGVMSGICLYNGNESFFKNVAMPVVQATTDAETAHFMALLMAKYRILPKLTTINEPILHSKLFGLDFVNPVGLAAGFDKDAEAIPGLLSIGFGFVEVGSVTPRPQEGNHRPRIFRLPKDSAIINRCGFNSKGHDYAYNQLKKVPRNGVIGVSLGKNKNSHSAELDYITGVRVLGPLADYLVINVSSPNTPGLRQLQQKQSMENILNKVLETRNSLPDRQPPVLIKISPDLSEEWKKDIAEVVTKKGSAVDGLIICNTSVERPDTLRSADRGEAGGLSGKPLRDHSTALIRDMYKLTKGSVPIIGVGGVFTGRDAYDKIRAGASLVQVYSSLVFQGPPVVNKIIRELKELLMADGFSSVSEAVGIDNKP